MPIFYQQDIDKYTKIGIWEITEGEDFFLSVVSPGRKITHTKKRLQHLAGRYLLQVLCSDFPVEEIKYTPNGQPALPGGQFRFSISHCGSYAAAFVAQRGGAGIDIELITPRIKPLAKKFLIRSEEDLLKEYDPSLPVYLHLLTALWSGKEAVYKWYGLKKVDFKQHIQLINDKIIINPDKSINLVFNFSKQMNIDLRVIVKLFDGFVLSYIDNG